MFRPAGCRAARQRLAHASTRRGTTGDAASRAAAAAISSSIDPYASTCFSVTRVGGSIGRPRRSIGRTHRTSSASPPTLRVSWPLGQPGQEEVRVVTPRLEFRRDPAGPWCEQVGAQREVAGATGTRRSRVDARPARRAPPPNRHRRRRRQSSTRSDRREGCPTLRTPRVPRRRRWPPPGPASDRVAAPTPPRPVRPTGCRRRQSRGSTEPPGKAYMPGANAIVGTRRIAYTS